MSPTVEERKKRCSPQLGHMDILNLPTQYATTIRPNYSLLSLKCKFQGQPSSRPWNTIKNRSLFTKDKQSEGTANHGSVCCIHGFLLSVLQSQPKCSSNSSDGVFSDAPDNVTQH